MPHTPTPIQPQHPKPLQGISASLAEKLARLDIHNQDDLLFHLPLRYRDLTRITPLRALRLNSELLVEGTIQHCEAVSGRRRSLACVIGDGHTSLTLRFYYFSWAQQQQLLAGKRVRAWGEIKRGAHGIEMYHPQYRLLMPDEHLPLTEHLTPVYPSTDGLQQHNLRKLTEKVLATLRQTTDSPLLEDYLPPALLPSTLDISLSDALLYLHQPPTNASVVQLETGAHPAQQRLVFEELLAHHLSLLRAREQTRNETAAALPQALALHERFLNQLPFQLTAAQQRVAAEIASDLAKNQPMLRLLQGDVGCGKTVVAALAVLQALASGKQAALMAPTEILAEQHYQNFCQWLTPLGFTVVWLAGSQRTKARRETLAALRDGSAQMAIGTQALFQENVIFQDVALVVADEQHRFGVRQRLALQQKGTRHAVHQLIMTATPIPRTLAMSSYADLDISVIDERPPHRTPVHTVVLSNARRPEVIARLRDVCKTGRQVYWVCTLIEESELLQCQAAEAVAKELALCLSELRIGLVHGRLKPAEKAMIMAAFKNGDLHVLVATTVIEVGVDVPNASLMVIENPERLGLAQLHQLRGRVGRGNTASQCLLIYMPPLSHTARARLAVLRDSNDGFVIAEKDLSLRGPGELLGTRQTGEVAFRIADLTRDGHWLPAIKHCAEQMLRDYPQHIAPLLRRWLRTGERYART